MTIGYSDIDNPVSASGATILVALKDEFYDLRGLAAYSKLGKSTIRDYIKRHGLPHYRIAGKLLVKRSEFDAWMNKFKGKSNLDEIVKDAVESLNNG